MAGQLPRSKSWSPGECKFPVLARHGAWACGPHLISRYRGSLAASLTASFFRQDILTCACDGCCWHGGAIHGGGGWRVCSPRASSAAPAEATAPVLGAVGTAAVVSPFSTVGRLCTCECLQRSKACAGGRSVSRPREAPGGLHRWPSTDRCWGVDLLGCLPPVQLRAQSPLLSIEAQTRDAIHPQLPLVQA